MSKSNWMVQPMVNKSAPYSFIIPIALLLWIGCGAEFATMRTADLAYLNQETMDDLQLYSGNREIIFTQVAPSETGISGYQELSDLPPFTIPAHTPGQVVEYDSITAELAIWFDGMIPPLVYKDNGRGVELITIDFQIGIDQYLRRDHLLNWGIGKTTFMEPYYLSRKLPRKKDKPLEPREAEGIEIEIEELERD
ncbi:hypothetical protein ACFL6E_01140 [Candidatus Neomarinimicrobiota bacterium]